MSIHGKMQILTRWGIMLFFLFKLKHGVEEIECRAMGDPEDVFKIWKAREGEEG